jgi:hypothetical protein
MIVAIILFATKQGKLKMMLISVILFVEKNKIEKRRRREGAYL